MSAETSASELRRLAGGESSGTREGSSSGEQGFDQLLAFPYRNTPTAPRQMKGDVDYESLQRAEREGGGSILPCASSRARAAVCACERLARTILFIHCTD
ncbi:hypothetical protein CgunFtcFv8_005806 [Champsocephalus gunnari]|uniref:Uncharacterized protein n=1 Tax=Champsocephalus gunnari TaxID=52237 RepID=A0AAN8CW95_CHAGU|nr:hypothetical protein CgunFtcFv8_005806 [Champsocephalus gunnari]